MENGWKRFFSTKEKKAPVAKQEITRHSIWEKKTERLQVRIDLLEHANPDGYNEGCCLWCGKKRTYKGEHFCLSCGIDLAAMSDEGFQIVLKNFELRKTQKLA